MHTCVRMKIKMKWEKKANHQQYSSDRLLGWLMAFNETCQMLPHITLYTAWPSPPLRLFSVWNARDWVSFMWSYNYKLILAQFYIQLFFYIPNISVSAHSPARFMCFFLCIFPFCRSDLSLAGVSATLFSRSLIRFVISLFDSFRLIKQYL